MAKRKNETPALAPVDPRLTAKALAKAVHDGDVVNFRLLFSPFSPARPDSPEQFDMPKYAYLLPDETQERDPLFKKALAAVERVPTHAHIARELEANRPAQLPSSLLVLLGDNAVRSIKYTSAAQAYEMLRIRRRMQEEFFAQADEAIEQGALAKAVRGYSIATGLAYDYAAFPEPLPSVPDYQTQALMLHAEYPRDPSSAIGMQEPAVHVRTALTFLLGDAAAAARLEARPLDLKVAFAKELVRLIDPDWARFAQRYREASRMVREGGQRFARTDAQVAGTVKTLADEIEETFGEDPRTVSAQLLGRTIPDGEWWQYLKDLAYAHPAAPLFAARLLVGEIEILTPCHRPDSQMALALDLHET